MDLTDAPLRTDHDLLERAEVLVGTAFRRQLWLLLIDEDACQLPALPVLELPSHLGESEVEQLARTVQSVLDHGLAPTLAVVWELPGGSEHEREVLPSMLAAAVTRLGGHFRAQLVATRTGVTSWIAPAVTPRTA